MKKPTSSMLLEDILFLEEEIKNKRDFEDIYAGVTRSMFRGQIKELQRVVNHLKALRACEKDTK